MQDLIWLGIAEMDADLNDLKQIGTTAIHGTSKNVPPDVIPGNWGLLTVSANSKNGQVGCTQHLSIMVTEGYFPQIYERNWNGLNWSKWGELPQPHHHRNTICRWRMASQPMGKAHIGKRKTVFAS